MDVVDLNEDGNLWVRVSPTASFDDARRTVNQNWKVGADDNIYVRASAVTGTVVVTTPDSPVLPAPQTKSSDYY